MWFCFFGRLINFDALLFTVTNNCEDLKMISGPYVFRLQGNSTVAKPDSGLLNN